MIRRSVIKGEMRYFWDMNCLRVNPDDYTREDVCGTEEEIDRFFELGDLLKGIQDGAERTKIIREFFERNDNSMP